MEIGEDIASVYGGECYDYKIIPEEEKVEFFCKEHGENFVSELTYQEIKEEYGLDLTQSKS